MEKVIFTKHGILCSFWDAPTTKWTEKKLSETELPVSWILPYMVEIEDGLTIRELLESLKPFEDAMSFMFLNDLMGLSFNTVRDSLLNGELDDHKIKTDVITLMWNGDVDQGENPGINIYPTIMSVEFDEKYPDNEMENFQPLHDISLADMLGKPFELDNWIEMFETNQIGVPILSGEFSWSFYDFMRGLISELTIFAYNKGLVTLPGGVQNTPLTIDVLFEHLDGLDNFYETKK